MNGTVLAPNDLGASASKTKKLTFAMWNPVRSYITEDDAHNFTSFKDAKNVIKEYVKGLPLADEATDDIEKLEVTRILCQNQVLTNFEGYYLPPTAAWE